MGGGTGKARLRRDRRGEIAGSTEGGPNDCRWEDEQKKSPLVSLVEIEIEMFWTIASIFFF